MDYAELLPKYGAHFYAKLIWPVNQEIILRLDGITNTVSKTVRPVLYIMTSAM